MDNKSIRNFKMIKTVILCMAIFFLLAMPASVLATDYYVKTPANGGDDGNAGTSWAEAKATIGAAMLATGFADKVNVAAAKKEVAANQKVFKSEVKAEMASLELMGEKLSRDIEQSTDALVDALKCKVDDTAELADGEAKQEAQDFRDAEISRQPPCASDIYVCAGNYFQRTRLRKRGKRDSSRSHPAAYDA